MRLLFDQNISFRILRLLPHEFAESGHARLLGLHGSSDMAIWEYAREHDFAIVTFDSDFTNIATVKGHPPKIILLRCGNTTTHRLAQLLLAK